MQPRRLGAWRRAWYGASAPHACRHERPNPEPWWRELWRERTPGEHRRAASAWPGYEVESERTPGGSKASKRACRPLTGEPSVGGERTVRATHLRVRRGDRTSDREERRPGSCVPGPPSGGRERQRAGAKRESGREDPAGAAPATVGERTRKEASGPRERVRLPGKGKLWRGAPGTRAA